MGGRLLLVIAGALASTAVAVAVDSFDAKVKTTKADQRAATAALLRFSDLGMAWAGGAAKPVSVKIVSCPSNQPNNSDLVITGHAESTLSLGSQQVDTDVEVFRTAKMVDKLWKRMVVPATSSCLKYNLAKVPGGSSLSFGAVSQPTLPAVGTHSILYRVPVKVKSNGQTVTVYSDYIFLSKGRTQFFVNIVAPSNLGAQLLALESRIARTLAARAKV